MKTSGNFNYYLDNESKTIEEIMHLVTSDMTVSIRGLDVLYFSAKYETNKILDKATKQIELDKLCQRFSEIKLKNYEKENIKKEVLDKLFGWKPINNSIKVHEKDELSDVDKKYFKVIKESKKVELEMWKKFKQEALEQLGIKDIGFLGFSAQKNKTEELLKEVEEYQKQNGGILKGVEFPFNSNWYKTPLGKACLKDITPNSIDILNARQTKKEWKVLEDWSREPNLTYWQRYGDILSGDIKRQNSFIIGEKENTKEGIKETERKLHYELSWEFIEEMAKRMANNKSDKYPLYNWKKSIDVQDLKDAINRHHIEVMKGNYQDGSEVLGHIISYACNAMMLWEQLNKK
jgi:hypothetical protein